MTRELLFFISSLGVFNCVLVITFLLAAPNLTHQRKWLVALLLALTVRISKSIWFYFNPDLSLQVLQLGLSACFLIGPLLYFYIVATHTDIKQLRLPWLPHLSLVFALIVCVGMLFPYVSYPQLWQTDIFRGINYSWGIYLLMAFIVAWPDIKSLLRKRAVLSNDKILSLNVLLGVSIIWLAFFTASYTSYIMGAVSFSFMLYLIFLVRFLAPKQSSTESYAEKKIEPLRASELADKLTLIMVDEGLYKNPNLTLSELAKKVQVSAPQLSQLLNDNLNKSFANYVNEWRIQEAKRLLQTSSRLTMELVSEACGFNSQSTFYTAFKQFVKMTPSNYRKQQQSVV